MDLIGNRLVVHREPAEAEYRSRETLEAGATITALAAPNVSVRVSDLLP